MRMTKLKKQIACALICLLVLSCVPIADAFAESGADDLSWWQKTNAYEVYVNSFQDTDGNGYGDINGVTEHLDHFRTLGVGALWLTPVFVSPMKDNGYDVADYYTINPLYGSNEDMDRLLEEAGKKGIRIVMDLVFNHTSDQHEWFQASMKSRDNAYSDWYIWRDAKPDGSVPNNWRSIFGGSVWTWCEARQQYYMHTFADSQPDLNWENPKVRQALCDIASYWVDKGVGGFRMDAIPYIKNPEGYPDGEPDGSDGMVSVHAMTANTEGILDFLHEFKDKVQEGTDIFTVGEANGVSPEDLPDWIGAGGVFDMVFSFDHLNDKEIYCEENDWSLKDLKKALSDSQAATAENGWYPIYFENHDRTRSINNYFPEDADPTLAGRAMGTVLLTLRGTPFLYEGEELGYENVAWPSIDDYNDLNAKSQYEIALERGFSEEEALGFVQRYSRDNARTPMQWNGKAQAGFTTGTPWLPVHDDYRTENAEAEAADPASVLQWYITLVNFRKANDVLIDGSYTEINAASDQVYAFLRENGDEKLLVAVNFTGENAPVDLSEAGIDSAEDAAVLLSSYENIDEAGANAEMLRPYEAIVVRAADSSALNGQDRDAAEESPEQTKEAQLIKDMILYYGCYGGAAEKEISDLLAALKETDNGKGKLWEDIMDYWQYADIDMAVNTEKLPDTLPGDDSLAIVILGNALNPDGSMRDELIDRLKTGLACAKQYPNAWVVCTGGGTAENNKDVTEAGAMGAWLLDHGLEENRLILEDRSLSTIENAQYTLDILGRERPGVHSLAIVSSDFHVARGALLFETVSLMEKQDARVVSNCAAPAPDRDFTEEYLRGWQMYNMLQLIGERDLAWQYVNDPDNFPRPELYEQAEAA